MPTFDTKAHTCKDDNGSDCHFYPEEQSSGAWLLKGLQVHMLLGLWYQARVFCPKFSFQAELHLHVGQCRSLYRSVQFWLGVLKKVQWQCDAGMAIGEARGNGLRSFIFLLLRTLYAIIPPPQKKTRVVTGAGNFVPAPFSYLIQRKSDPSQCLVVATGNSQKAGQMWKRTMSVKVAFFLPSDSCFDLILSLFYAGL